jgi:hypothetical protein
MTSKSLQQRLERTALARNQRRSGRSVVMCARVSDVFGPEPVDAGNPRPGTAFRDTLGLWLNPEFQISAPGSVRIMARDDF